MKLPNTERGFPEGEPTSDWTAEQFLAYVKNQYKHLTAPDGEIRKAVGATDADIEEMRNTIDNLEKVIAYEQSLEILSANLKREKNEASDALMNALDKSGRKGAYLPPSDILRKKGN